MDKHVYLFNEGNANMRDILGGKGANLAEMTNLGLPVPMGFTVSTKACNKYYEDNLTLSDEIKQQIELALNELEEKSGKKLGDINNPLLLSVRSGARASMPGMMDTILNLGLNDRVTLSLASITNNERFANDSYRRFIQMYSDVVKGIPKSDFENIIDDVKKQKGITSDLDLDTSDLQVLIDRFKEVYKKYINEEFPEDPKEQLFSAIAAVFNSWNNERAQVYRRLNNIPSSWGTAVNVQMMVFGNMGNDSGTGVAFTRNPATGEKGLFGEYLMNAQGEDVVAGIRTPKDISSLASDLPDCYNEFVKISELLEDHYSDMQDMEFTIENKKLYILQTRAGKRTAQAAIKIACDLVNSNKITKEEALLRIDAKSLDQLLHPVFDKDALANASKLASGLPASPGAASGSIVFSAKDAKKAAENNQKVILVRLETTPEDIEGMVHAQGILTIRGGMTSHAAVVARGMGVCCVSGCEAIKIDEVNKKIFINDKEYSEGDFISIDGNTGLVYEGEIKTVESTISGDFATVMSWADEIRTLNVKANADNPKDTQKAIELGASGIGLCRTEHMFFESDRILKIREMILAENDEAREKALDELYKFQKHDFKKMYEVLKELPMTVRYLDPPLHEFLPKKEEEIVNLANAMGIDVNSLKTKINDLKEVNPMMGHRGCRLLISYPSIAIMQTKALIEAAIEVTEEFNYLIEPEIMIPLVGDEQELAYISNIVKEEAERIIKNHNSDMKYKIGTMIEVPKAALVAEDIALHAEFFSFGTNDLTQMTFGFSRDDAAKFLEDYYEKNIFETDPFTTIDEKSVGMLVKLAVLKAKSVKEDFEFGICGEHGGDPKSIEFFNELGLDYVSCSPYRVPIARLAAAQAAIKEHNK